MAGLDPAISLGDAMAQCPPKRDHRVKPGDDAEYVAGDRGLSSLRALTLLQYADIPPSAGIAAPFTIRDSSDARNSATLAMSWASPMPKG